MAAGAWPASSLPAYREPSLLDRPASPQPQAGWMPLGMWPGPAPSPDSPNRRAAGCRGHVPVAMPTSGVVDVRGPPVLGQSD